MQLIRDAWASIPPTQRWIVAVVVGVVLIAAMYFGVLPAMLAWLGAV